MLSIHACNIRKGLAPKVDSFDKIQKRVHVKLVLRIQEGLRDRPLNKIAHNFIDIIFLRENCIF